MEVVTICVLLDAKAFFTDHGLALDEGMFADNNIATNNHVVTHLCISTDNCPFAHNCVLTDVCGFVHDRGHIDTGSFCYSCLCSWREMSRKGLTKCGPRIVHEHKRTRTASWQFGTARRKNDGPYSDSGIESLSILLGVSNKGQRTRCCLKQRLWRSNGEIRSH